MGRTLTIKRIKNFSGSLINYFCILDADIRSFKDFIDGKEDTESNFIQYKIANGKEISFEISKNEHKLFVFVYTSIGPAYSNKINISPGDLDEIYIIRTKYNVFKGSSFILEKLQRAN